MTRRRVTNLAASIRQRLLQVAQATGRPFQEILQYYAMERFLFRLSVSPYANEFVLKGALMLNVWGVTASRPTRDIDLLGHLPNEIEPLVEIIRHVCRHEVEQDALVFDASSANGVVIKEHADYEGVRITFRGSLQNMRIPMQIDIGFGDVVFPEATITEYPVLLNHAPPRLRGYRRETIVAEKFEAIVKLGLLNSRMKDFFDIWLLSRQFDFDGVTLVEAIQRTFANRRTTVTDEPTAFTTKFATDPGKIAQWRAFVRRLRLNPSTPDLTGVCRTVVEFLSPPAKALRIGRPFKGIWRAGGPWTESD